MLQIQLLRNNRDLVIEGLQKKNFKQLELVDEIIALDEKYRKINQQIEEFTAVVNKNNSDIGKYIKTDEEKVTKLKLHNKILKEKIDELEKDTSIKDTITEKLLLLPNLPHKSVPFGSTPEENEIIKDTTKGKGFTDIYRKPHWELIEEYNLASLKLGTKLTGNGFPVFIGNGVRLQRALIQYFANYNMTAGYTEYSLPHLVNEATAYGTGQLPDKEGQMYYTEKDKLYLIPTAEVPLTNIYRDEVVNNLPIKMSGYTPCFRRESGSYGKEVRGLNRVHQFDKVEIVQLVHPDKSYEALEEMVAHVEKLLINLELPYRILRLCGGDMSFASALTYDFEVYSKAQDLWLEVSSVSNFETFQSNRMKIRYKDGKKNALVHTLNGSSLALPRIIACLLENNQTEKGIKLPKVMATYFGNEYITK
jgi:seryl-tRNA synthetase